VQAVRAARQLIGNCSAPIVTQADADEVEHLLTYR
jgi:hypothetical protein